MRTFEVSELTQEDRVVISNWWTMDEKLTRFYNESNMGTFKVVFGDVNGERLWIHYVTNCKRDYYEFKKYLTIAQLNLLLVNVLKNSIMYAV